MWLELLSDQSVELLSCVRLFVTPRTAACQASLFITNFWSLLRLMSMESVMPSNHLILSVSSCFQSFPASGSFPVSQLFVSSGQSISFNFSISPSNEYSDWFLLGLTHLISLQSKYYLMGASIKAITKLWNLDIQWKPSFWQLQEDQNNATV